MKRPNFFILGAPKCGTSSLAHWLGQHPQIFMSAFKEPHYFNTDDSFRFMRDENDYIDLFKLAGSEHLAVGEASTWYLFSKSASAEIEKFTSGAARYIVCLRDPVEMAPSLHGQIHFSGGENEADFRRAWELQTARANGRHLPRLSNQKSHLQYFQACALGQQLTRLFEVVPRERVCVIWLEDMAKDAQSSYDRVLEFLGVPPSEIPINLIPTNKAHRPRSILVTRMVSLGSAFRRRLGLKSGFGLLTSIRNSNKLMTPRPALDPAFIAELRVAFDPEVAQLERLLGRDLSHWRAP